MQMKRLTAWVAMTAAAALILAACGGEEEAAAPEPEAPSEPAEAEDEEEEAPEAEPAGWEPERDVTVIVPFNPGGGADTSQRTWNEYAQPLLDVNLNVENPAGAGGVTGWGQMVQQAGDGYTITIATPPFNVLPKAMDPQAVPFEHEDFTYICIYGVVPGAIYVSADNDQFEDLEAMLEYGFENPGALTVATVGAAGAETLIAHQIMMATDVEFSLVPFDGGSESVVALRGGQVDLMIGSTQWIEEQAGEVRALAIARATDEGALFAEIPSFIASGYDVVSERYRSLAGPPNFDADALAFWTDICEQVHANDDFRQAMADTGNPAPASFIGPEEATQLVMRMVADVEQVVETAGLTSE